MDDYTLSKIVKFDGRSGGYLDYAEDCNSSNTHMLTEEAAGDMLNDFNGVLTKYFPWMRDFVIFKLQDDTVRLDVADRQFLSADGSE